MENRLGKSFVICTILAGSLQLSGCLTSGEVADPGSTPPTGSNPPPPPSGNAAPTISGSPAALALVGSAYTFSPTSADSDDDPLTFSITGLPAWLSFDQSTGELSGTPMLGDVGTFDNIVITVSDGTDATQLPGFSISVSAVANGSTTLAWNPPTANVDGSPLTDLAGYFIYFGQSPRDYPNRIEISNPGLTTYVVDNLLPTTYYCAMTAVNDVGVESGYSDEAVRTIN